MVFKIHTGNNLHTNNLSSDAHTSQTQVDEVENFVSRFINNVLSENEVHLNESGMLHNLRPPVY